MHSQTRWFPNGLKDLLWLLITSFTSHNSLTVCKIFGRTTTSIYLSFISPHPAPPLMRLARLLPVCPPYNMLKAFSAGMLCHYCACWDNKWLPVPHRGLQGFSVLFFFYLLLQLRPLEEEGQESACHPLRAIWATGLASENKCSKGCTLYLAKDMTSKCLKRAHILKGALQVLH